MKNTRFVRLCSTALILLVLCGIACPASAAIGDGDFEIMPPDTEPTLCKATIGSLVFNAKSVAVDTQYHSYGSTDVRFIIPSTISVTWTCTGNVVPTNAPNYSYFKEKTDWYDLVDSVTIAGYDTVTVPGHEPSGIYRVVAMCSGRSVQLSRYYDIQHTNLEWEHYSAFAPVENGGYFYYEN